MAMGDEGGDHRQVDDSEHRHTAVRLQIMSLRASGPESRETGMRPAPAGGLQTVIDVPNLDSSVSPLSPTGLRLPSTPVTTEIR